MKKVTVIVLMLLTLGCTTKYIKFKPSENEIFSTDRLSTFLKSNPSPKVVLRTPSMSSQTTEEEDVSYLYSAIEKELLSNGFIVRDRNLFNQVVSNNENTVDYAKLKTKTDTDLIIELIKLDRKVIYETNEYYTDKGKTGLLEDPYKQYGAVVEFKVVLIDNNEFAGTYKFHYAPCAEGKGCEISESFKERMKRIEKEKEGYVIVEKDILEEFMRHATYRLVEDMRK
ncbi:MULTISPECIES: hypothetical protein [Flavobacteriaceae]|uniref:hypothetical protein n=1 Tax=Flavobacteriaceae TaxID=49546 RepID=UPI000C36E89A|nr:MULTISPECIES: hypothetical protein [Flavobacteriaceae]HAB26939.1 hypothetical protein [Xanthomarina gelatinilytica]MAL22068.1 hypothetical protein [Xanthomarina sp.]MBF62074.1 hypothetical protein [Xanthomarina sp.]MDX1279197.1 hypothetical protein [Oceanihabitans sediminis]HAI18619.1 hypothetical protein [Xanthomarina gelatinilytica]|tara:strand:+ start:163 stop:843 length:681 start_codon:yes stop_codon:yes gene_type:complete